MQPTKEKPQQLTTLEATDLPVYMRSGDFWEMELGKKVGEFAISKLRDTRAFSPAQAALVLGLERGHNSALVIYELIRKGVLVDVEYLHGSHIVLRREHVLLAGLVLLYAERFSDPDLVDAILADALEGTYYLNMFFGTTADFITNKGRNFFAPTSPWRSFPVATPIVGAENTNDSGKEKDGRSRPRDPFEEIEDNVDRKGMSRSSPGERVPEVDIKMLGEYDAERIAVFFNELPSTPETIGARHASPGLVQAVMFIAETHNGTVVRYSPDDDYSLIGLKNGLEICARYMRVYPGIKNLAQLFVAIRKIFLKDPHLYWDSPRALK